MRIAAALLLLVDYSATFNPLPSFALWLAFPTSDYYDGSDSHNRPLRICAH